MKEVKLFVRQNGEVIAIDITGQEYLLEYHDIPQGGWESVVASKMRALPKDTPHH